MVKSFLFELISPEKVLFSEQVLSVILPGADGYRTILPDHAPLMALIIPGIVKVQTTKGREHSFVVYDGVAEIRGNVCSLLAQSVIERDLLDTHSLKERIDFVRKELLSADHHDERNRLEDFLHQLTTVHGVLTEA